MTVYMVDDIAALTPTASLCRLTICDAELVQPRGYRWRLLAKISSMLNYVANSKVPDSFIKMVFIRKGETTVKGL